MAMFVFYRGLGLVWALLGAILAPILLFATSSLSVALFAVAGFWIFFGRGNFEPKALTDLDNEGRPKSPTVFFMPVWFYGALVVPLALVAAGIEFANGRILVPRDQDERQAAADSGQSAFDAANDSITSAGTGVAHGNTEFARTLAEACSELMKDITAQAFTGGREGPVSLTKGNFVTYCHVNEQDSVVFLVHVPQLRQYKGDVRDTLAELSWTAARRLILETRASETMTLAVGLRGTILYGPIMIDSVSTESIVSSKGERADFYRYFVEPENPETDLNTDQLMADVGTAPTANESQSDRPEEAPRSSDNTDSSHRSATRQPSVDSRTGAASRVEEKTEQTPQQAKPVNPDLGRPVTADTELAPGQKLAARRGGAWYQVIVTGFRRDSVLTAWVHSNVWKSYAMRRSDLRLVTDAEYADCRKKYNDEPVTRQPLPKDTEIQPGDSLLCRISDYWLPVVATGLEDDGSIPVKWVGFDDRFDESVERNRLAKSDGRSRVVARNTSRPISSPSEPGLPVTADTELGPGRKLAGKWGGKMVPGDRHGFQKRESADGVGPVEFLDVVFDGTQQSATCHRRRVRQVSEEIQRHAEGARSLARRRNG